jgi:D-alanyl-D-alanine carboxypeptidase
MMSSYCRVRSLPRRRFLATTSLAVASFALQAASGCGGAADPRYTLICNGAAPYQGAATRAPLADSVFAGAGADALPLPPMPDSLAAALERRLAELLEVHGGPAWDVALFRPGQGLWSRRVGLASRVPARPVQAQTPFWWASVGKTLTAALTLQCVSEGRLKLQDKLSQWRPDFPQASHISVASLLDHTNGTRSYNSPDALGPVQSGPYRTPDELLALPMQRGNLTCPGAVFSYTNTGYLLLALVLESVLGKALHQIIEQRLTGPLGLGHLSALPPGPLAADLALPHINGLPQSAQGLASLMGAGNVVGSAKDMLGFWHALLGGRVLPPAIVRSQFARLLPMGEDGLWYGQGVMVFDFRDRGGFDRVWLGHSGGGQGNNAIVLYEPARKAFAAVAVNGDTPAAAVATAMLEVLDEAAWMG